MARRTSAAAFLGALMITAAAWGQAADAEAVRQADELEKRWGDYYLKYDDVKEIARLDKVAEAARATLGADGRFSDLKGYKEIVTGRDGGKEGWGEHLIRTADMFTAWRLPGTKVHKDAEFARLCQRALEAYIVVPYDLADRWGFGHPYADLLENNRIGRCCLFARTDPATFRQEDIERWAGRIIPWVFKPESDPAKQFTEGMPGFEGGANLLWCTRGEIVPYLVGRDQELRVRALDRYFKYVWDSMLVRTAKGPYGEIGRLTVDGMLGEHEVPCMGSYGEWYVNALVEYRNGIEGIARWQMPETHNAHWIDVLLDSVAYTYQGAVDPGLANPMIWLNARRGGNVKLKEWLSAFQGKGHREAEIAAMLAWEPGVTAWPVRERSVRMYYTSDYMSKHFPKFMASVRAVSERTFGVETFGQKNVRRAEQSVFVPLGMLLLRRDTREFQQLDNDIWGAADFARLPGLTTRHVDGAALAAAWNRDREGYAVRYVTGNTPYSGGVEAAHTGVMGWWQSRFVVVDRSRHHEIKQSDLSVDGRRAVFFLEDAVVNLGAGFDVRHGSEPTFTSLEQRVSGAEETTYGAGMEMRKLRRGEEVKDAGMTWAWHEGVGYLPPSHGTKVLRDVVQEGERKRQVFSFYSDHGRTEAALSFEWALLPDVTAERTAELAKVRPWTVVSNTTSVQAIAVPGRGWLGAVFHHGGDFKSEVVALHASRPAVVIVQVEGDSATVYAADPYERGGELLLRVNDTTVTLNMPDGEHRGSTVTAKVKLGR
jgi:hypothetical protein